MRTVLKLPYVVGFAVLILGFSLSVRGLWPSAPDRYHVQLAPAAVQLKSEEVQLVLYLDPLNLELSQPKYKTLELPQNKRLRLLQIVSVLRDNLADLWPDALPLPEIFLYEQTAILHFYTERPVATSVSDEVRLYRSIQSTLQENGVSRVRILVNDQNETFLGHLALSNTME